MYLDALTNIGVVSLPFQVFLFMVMNLKGRVSGSVFEETEIFKDTLVCIMHDIT